VNDSNNAKGQHPMTTTYLDGRERTSIKLGSRTFSIRQTRYDNWYGYIGSTKVESFGNDSQGTQEQHARAWLDEQRRTYGSTLCERCGEQQTTHATQICDACRAECGDTRVAPRFSPEEVQLLAAHAYDVWNYCAHDVLQAVADDKGRSIERVSVSRDEAIEIALDADRLESELTSLLRRGRHSSLLTHDLLARWQQLTYDERIAIARVRFTHSRYGL